jgi:hypothetical protein
MITSRKTENLLQDAGRFTERLIGWACALISGADAALLVCLVYLIAWRNPRESGVNDLYKVSTLAILGALLGIAVGFAMIAFRLIGGRRLRSGLMSPMVLRFWGLFFGLAGAFVLVDGIVRKRWLEVPRYWEVFAGGISMACAAFVLARRRERGAVNENSISQQSAGGNNRCAGHYEGH